MKSEPPASLEAYCLVVLGDGAWELTTGGLVRHRAVGGAAVLANGTLPLPFNPENPHDLAIHMTGDLITAFVDGMAVAAVNDTSYGTGSPPPATAVQLPPPKY